ncbi:MAG: DUF4878 domain-containing protein [Spirochaetota bacterium]|nr:DUF4878 domain-containing protein [Spirochaetota bacterium]
MKYYVVRLTIIFTVFMSLAFITNCGDKEKKSADATTQPADATSKPADATAQPADATAKPADATTQPADATVKPADATTQPADATTQPADATAKPADATAKPADATAKPADATAKPADATADNPKSVVETYISSIKGKDVDGSLNLLIKKQKEKFSKNEKAKKKFAKIIAKTEKKIGDATPEEPKITGNNATVNFSKNKKKVSTINLVKEDGQWKIKL